MPLTRRLILQKARHHTQGALTDCKHMVSGTISLPSRGTFHHSLTVLSTIGHNRYLALPSGLGRFTRDSTSPVLLGHNTMQSQQFHLHDYHALRSSFPTDSTITTIYHYTPAHRHWSALPHNTPCATPDRYHTHKV